MRWYPFSNVNAPERIAVTRNYPSVLVLSAMLTIVTQVAPARELDSSNVRQAVEIWVRHVTADAKHDANIEQLEPWMVNQQTVAFIAHLTGEGFCLCGADDRVLPVYLYVPKGEFDPQSPSNLFVLDEIAKRTAAFQDFEQRGVNDPNLSAELADRAGYWQTLIAGGTPDVYADERSAPSMMTLSLTCTWNQTTPYNDYCPTLTSASEQTVTGCVATAAAQVMYYWKWPVTGEGQSSMDYPYGYRFNWDSEPLSSDPGIPVGNPFWTNRLRWSAGALQMNGYWDQSTFNAASQIAMNNTAYQTALTALFGRLSPEVETQYANHAATTYNWAAMRDSVADPPDAASDAIALLSYHAGVACLMHWGVLGSNTGSTEKQHALRDNFRYDSDIMIGPRDSNLITDEIQWFRPVTIGGDGPGGGHDWVVYGYNTATDPNRQFMMNFGWGGGSNGWYSFDAVNTGNGSFNNNQWHVARIAPRGIGFVNAGGSGNGKPATPYGSIGQALQLAPDYSTLIFKAGSYNSNGGAVINFTRPMTLKGVNATLAP